MTIHHVTPEVQMYLHSQKVNVITSPLPQLVARPRAVVWRCLRRPAHWLVLDAAGCDGGSSTLS